MNFKKDCIKLRLSLFLTKRKEDMVASRTTCDGKMVRVLLRKSTPDDGMTAKEFVDLFREFEGVPLEEIGIRFKADGTITIQEIVEL